MDEPVLIVRPEEGHRAVTLGARYPALDRPESRSPHVRY